MKLVEFSIGVDSPYEEVPVHVLGQKVTRQILVEKPRRIRLEMMLVPEAGDTVALDDDGGLFCDASVGNHAHDLEIFGSAGSVKDEVREAVEEAIADFLAGRTNSHRKPASQRSADEQSRVERELADHTRQLNAQNKRLVAQAREREDVAARLLSEWQEMRKRVMELENERVAQE